jgi:hypothetical protein
VHKDECGADLSLSYLMNQEVQIKPKSRCESLSGIRNKIISDRYMSSRIIIGVNPCHDGTIP